MPGTLYIVGTPIGNLEDVTLRAIKILSEVDIVLAEDTRNAKKLFSLLNSKLKEKGHKQALVVIEESEGRNKISPKLLSYHQHSGEVKKLEILNYLLEGKNIALVTDAGTPGISDPGNELIEFLVSYSPEIKIVPIPGASAVTTALSVSGFRTDKFLFLGYWPKKKVNKLIELVKLIKFTFVYYDSPHRVLRNLETLEKALGSHTRVFIAREMTKLHETLYRGRIKEVKEKLRSEKKIRGELVVVVNYFHLEGG